MDKIATAQRSFDIDFGADHKHGAGGGGGGGIIGFLRHEALQEKEDFGWHAFQALSISAIALGGIFYFMFATDGFPAVGLGALTILAFVLVTCRLGDNCYASANRHYGFELFLYRVRAMQAPSEGRWKSEYQTIEWEAAMRAWRVVQASLYEAIYKPGAYITSDRRRRAFRVQSKAFWFCQSSLSRESGAKFHAGSYLQRMHTMLLLVAAASVVMQFVAAVAVPFKPIQLHRLTGLAAHLSPYGPVGTGELLTNLLFGICCVSAVFSTVLWFARYRAEKAKRRIMEDELLSIHACSIVWQAVVVAHFSTLDRAAKCKLSSRSLVELSRKLKWKHPLEWWRWKRGHLRFEALLDLLDKEEKGPPDGGAGISGYTFWLAEEAASLARCAVDVPGWVGLGEEELRRRNIVK
jgi:hypothetical protein